MSNKVLLVDDHPAMLIALRSMLLNQVLFEVVGQAINGEDCLKEIKKTNPDILILDLDMPKTDGFDLIRRISISYPNIRILVLSSMDEQIYGGRVRSIGGHGYVNKTANANIILAACVAVSQSYTFFSTARNGRSGLSDKEKLDSLSDREIQVMKFLTRGMGNLEMATNLNISSKTVATYKHRLFEKLSINGITDLIAFCHKNSLIEG